MSYDPEEIERIHQEAEALMAHGSLVDRAKLLMRAAPLFEAITDQETRRVHVDRLAEQLRLGGISSKESGKGGGRS